MMAYTLRSDGAVTRDADGAVIPNDPANSDWQAYQAWCAAGNEPNPVPMPAGTVPTFVSNFQARAQLIKIGRFADVDKAMADPSADPVSVQAWQYANNFYRASPFVAGMAKLLGFADADVDALFTAAAAIQ